MSSVEEPKKRDEHRSASQTARATLLLRQMVIDGHFQPGERIKEIPLAAELRVSRIPLRLVLERLAHEGLLEIRPTRGFVVQQFSTTDIYDAIDLRGLLEGTAARLACERLCDSRDLHALREAAEAMESLFRTRNKLTLEAFTSYIELNARFHSALVELSRSRILRRAVKQAAALPFGSPSAFLLKQQFGDARHSFLVALDHHRDIVEAIANREGMRAETLAREHARLARRNLDVALKDRELLKSVPGAKLIEL